MISTSEEWRGFAEDFVRKGIEELGASLSEVVAVVNNLPLGNTVLEVGESRVSFETRRCLTGLWSQFAQLDDLSFA
jgi:ABC-type transporter lipoprotein component MlaA